MCVDCTHFYYKMYVSFWSFDPRSGSGCKFTSMYACLKHRGQHATRVFPEICKQTIYIGIVSLNLPYVFILDTELIIV